jgi:hypothetical protein
MFPRLIELLVVPLLAFVAACADSDTPTARPTSVTRLHLPPADSPSLTLRHDGAAQVGVTIDGNQVRLRTALRTDDEAEARLCSVIIARSRSVASLPFAWPVDSTVPLLVPQLVHGPDVSGYRVVVPGVNSEYRFEGFTIDGSTRVSFRWPVRSGRSVPGDATDSEIEAALTPSPKALDTLVMRLRRSDTASRTGWRGLRLPVDSVVVARAVRLAPLVPLFPVGFTPACGDATFAVSLASAVDKPVRILAANGEEITVHVVTPTGEVSMYFDEQGPGQAVAGKAVTTTVVAQRTGHVTLRLRYRAAVRVEPARQKVMLRLVSTAPR